jgi:uncharacterized protein YbgA (DUF1722 family)
VARRGATGLKPEALNSPAVPSTTLNQVVDHYDGHFHLRLSAQQKADLVQFLKSL